jgi:type II secretory pathway pseudopilin PulG
MGVSRNDINIAGVSRDNPFARYANSVAMREQALQSNTSNALNMTNSLQDIASQTGMQGTINPADVPSVAGLANTQASIAASSNLRSKNTTEMVKGLPSYVKSYSNYLRWRYPSRYGGAKGTNYSTDFTQSGYDPADIADPFAPPGFGK